ncbi:hypothetical protein [Flavobacterium frigidarium]|jgi:hypothetical protein|uniref:Uncharacterized protein n=1 Tax=Flavobacterium frigidarium TaxID=99286 RepID=A0ABV4K8I2_9FLAO
MDTSVTIIALAITLLIATPLLFVFRSSITSKKKIKAIKETFNNYNFDLSEILNNKVMSLDEKKKAFLFMDFHNNEEHSAFIDLTAVSSCNLVLTTKKPRETVVRIDFEFQYKDSVTTDIVTIYTIENDQINQIRLYEEHQLAIKWKALIDNCIAEL